MGSRVRVRAERSGWGRRAVGPEAARTGPRVEGRLGMYGSDSAVGRSGRARVLGGALVVVVAAWATRLAAKSMARSYVNFRRMNTTKPMRASASVKAMPRNMVVRTMPAASGWRAMAVMALPTT